MGMPAGVSRSRKDTGGICTGQLATLPHTHDALTRPRQVALSLLALPLPLAYPMSS